MADMSLDGSLGNVNAQLQQLATDPLYSPESILPGKPLNEVDRTLRNSGTAASLRVGRVPREEPKPLSVPTDDGVWLPEQEGVSPVGKGARKQNHESPLTRTGLRLLDAPGRDDELLSQQGILLEEILPRAGEVDDQSAQQGGTGAHRFAQNLPRPGHEPGNLGSETRAENLEHRASVARMPSPEPVLFGARP